MREADLDRGVELATLAVKSAPLDAGARLALFETLCFVGDLDRAVRQLDAIASRSMEHGYGASALKALVEAEQMRREVMAGRARPDFLGEETAWAEPYLRAVREPVDGAALEEERTPVRGEINGRAFSDLRDADDLLAPVLEFTVAGRYVWLRWDQIRTLTSDEPTTLRHLCWLPVKIELKEGQDTEGCVPVLYAGSHTAPDSRLQLGHGTDWMEQNGLTRGVGRRVLFYDDDEIDILAVRQLSIADGD